MNQADMYNDNLASFLTEKIAVLMRSYDRLLEKEPSPADLGAYKLWSTTCKAAISHIELLARMVRQIDRTGGVVDTGGSLLDPGEMERAMADVAGFEDQDL